MPVITIHALPQRPEIDVTSVIAQVSQRVADAMGCPAQQVWTIWHPIEARHYTEGELRVREQPHSSHPPIVEIRAYQGRSPEVIRAAIETAADTICQFLQLEPGNAFVTYTELTPGRVFTGGAIQ